MLPGSPESEWGIDGGGSANIEGFATDISVDNGHTVSFKINTDSTHYRIDIYRIGYYGGDGARKVATIDESLPTAQDQPIPLFDPVTKLVDAGNWSVSATWDVPADAVSGVYFAKMTRLDGVAGENIIPFIVRDDENPSDITFQTSDTTWQAYNPWGGYNLYGSIDGALNDSRASAVSYNRPISTRGGGIASGPQDFIFGVEYPAIRWLEENGYNVNYISGVDTARDGAQLLNSQIFLSVGHDEYWSGSAHGRARGSAPAYAAADVILGMGGSALRGMAFGKPLIVQGELGFWQTCDPDSVNEFLDGGWYGLGDGSDGGPRLRAQLVPLLTDLARRVSLGQFSRNLVVDRFSLEQAARLQLSVYEQALERNRRPRVSDLARILFPLARYKIDRRWQRWRGTAAADDFNAIQKAGA